MASCKREMVSLPYTRRQLTIMWSYATHEDIMNGGRWDARVASLNYWDVPFSPQVRDDPPILLVTLYFSWGTSPRLWAVERLAKAPEYLPWLVLGDLERATLGATVHGMQKEVTNA